MEQNESFIVRNAGRIIIFSITGIIICIVLIVLFLIKRELTKGTYLTVQFAPSFAVLVIDGVDEELTMGSYEMPAGKYTGKLIADGFITKEIEFEIKDRQVNSVLDYLVNDKEGLKYYEKNASDVSVLRLIENDEKVNSFLEEYDKKISIYDKLPLDVSYRGELDTEEEGIIFNLEIRDGRQYSECKSSLCLLVVGLRRNDLYVAEILEENNYSIDDYEVYYEYSH